MGKYAECFNINLLVWDSLFNIYCTGTGVASKMNHTKRDRANTKKTGKECLPVIKTYAHILGMVEADADPILY